MQIGQLEHLNISVGDPQSTAAMLARIFGWETRWEGPSLNNGYTVHVGTSSSYIALYSVGTLRTSDLARFEKRGGLNHIGVVIDDIDAVEVKVIAEGFVPKNHADYEPGRRFYFYDNDGVEYEVISYVKAEQEPPIQTAKSLVSKPSFAQTVVKRLGFMAEFGALTK